ncbi:hypothetical protein C8R46DRAFT_1209877 [Mycena filopes]|nr:hypothetical protein C8R46DRAFT_1209877 [Mycena filopes]
MSLNSVTSSLVLFRAQSISLELPFDIWLHIATDVVSDPKLSARDAAYIRSAIASVNRDWKDRVYFTPSLWSRLIVDRALPLSRLEFYVSRCSLGPIDLTLPFRNMSLFGPVGAGSAPFHEYLDTVFSIVGGTSSRWRSFTFETESAMVYRGVAAHCSSLSAPNLVLVDVRCHPNGNLHALAGLSSGPASVSSPPWFTGELPLLRVASFACVPFNVAQLRSVTSLALADHTGPSFISPSILRTVFARSSNLTRLRLGALSPFPLEDAFVLRSRTLEELDMEFYRGDYVGGLFAALDAPLLARLTVRGVYDFVHALLVRSDILGRITHFRVRSDIGDRVSLQHLFNALTSMSVFDLQRSRPEVFQAYREWAEARVRFGQPCLAAGLRALLLPRCELVSVLYVVELVASNMPVGSESVGIESLRVHHPLHEDHAEHSLSWIRNLVPDFALTSPEDSSVLRFAVGVTLFPELIIYVLVTFTFDGSTPVADFIAVRNALLVTSSWINYLVMTTPAFWSRIIAAPGIPLTFVETCLRRSELERLYLCLYATQLGGASPTTFLDQRCSHRAYVSDAVHLFGVDVDRCAVLLVDADTKDLLEEVLDGLQWSEADCLSGILVRYSEPSYLQFRAGFLDDFRFASPASIGQVFPPITSLEWFAADVSNPLVTFSTTFKASAQLVHPPQRFLLWAEVLWIVLSSSYISSLTLDGLRLAPPHASAPFTTTPPMGSLRRLDVNFRGMQCMAALLCHLNAPGLRVLTLRAASFRDFSCLESCTTILAAIVELVVHSSAPAGYNFCPLFALLHRLQRLDIRGSSPALFHGLVRASSRPGLVFGSINWNACPFLSTLLVRGVSFAEVRALLETRAIAHLPPLGSVVVQDPVGVLELNMEMYFMAAGGRSFSYSMAPGNSRDDDSSDSDGGDVDPDLPRALAEIVAAYHESRGEPAHWGLPLARSRSKTSSSSSSSTSSSSSDSESDHPAAYFVPLPGALSDFPAEVWIIIFRFSCDEELDKDATFLSYLEARENIWHSHSHFAAVLDGCATFWTHLLVSCSTPLDYVERHVRSMKSLPVHVNIMLDPRVAHDLVIVPADFDSSDEEFCVANAVPCLLALLPTVPLWTRACVYCTTQALLLAFMEVLGDVSAPNLEYLLFTCPPPYGAVGRCDMMLSDPPSLFNGDMPKLSTLRIVSAALPWGDSAYFGGLDYLELRTIPRLAWPSTGQFVSSLVAGAGLRELVVRGGGVYWEADAEVEPFTLPQLDTLTVHYTPDTKWVMGVLSVGSYPSLVELVCVDFNRLAWVFALKTDIFQSLTSLTISGPATTISHIWILLGRLSSLVSLDLSDTNLCYFSEMYASPRLCPSLRCLCVRGETVARISTYVTMRAVDTRFALHTVHYFHNLTYPLPYLATALLDEARGSLVAFHVYPEYDLSTAPVVVC